MGAPYKEILIILGLICVLLIDYAFYNRTQVSKKKPKHSWWVAIFLILFVGIPYTMNDEGHWFSHLCPQHWSGGICWNVFLIYSFLLSLLIALIGFKVTPKKGN